MEPIFVLAETADGFVFVSHTRSEYVRLMDGVDMEASWAACAPLEETEQEACREH